mgnify:CR=1 FL=1
MFWWFAPQRNYDISERFLGEQINVIYSYFIGNDSLTLQVIKYLHSMPYLPIQNIKVIHQTPGWVVRVKMDSPLTPQEDRDFRAFMNELGVSYNGKLTCSWYICMTWTQGSLLSRLRTTIKLRWLFLSAWIRTNWKYFIRSL